VEGPGGAFFIYGSLALVIGTGLELIVLRQMEDAMIR
jgi:hypothetical protein